MGMGGNGNGFMGMGGNGNRNSHSRTPLLQQRSVRSVRSWVNWTTRPCQSASHDIRPGYHVTTVISRSTRLSVTPALSDRTFTESHAHKSLQLNTSHVRLHRHRRLTLSQLHRFFSVCPCRISSAVYYRSSLNSIRTILPQNKTQKQIRRHAKIINEKIMIQRRLIDVSMLVADQTKFLSPPWFMDQRWGKGNVSWFCCFTQYHSVL